MHPAGVHPRIHSPHEVRATMAFLSDRREYFSTAIMDEVLHEQPTHNSGNNCRQKRYQGAINKSSARFGARVSSPDFFTFLRSKAKHTPCRVRRGDLRSTELLYLGRYYCEVELPRHPPLFQSLSAITSQVQSQRQRYHALRRELKSNANIRCWPRALDRCPSLLYSVPCGKNGEASHIFKPVVPSISLDDIAGGDTA